MKNNYIQYLQMIVIAILSIIIIYMFINNQSIIELNNKINTQLIHADSSGFLILKTNYNPINNIEYLELWNGSNNNYLITNIITKFDNNYSFNQYITNINVNMIMLPYQLKKLIDLNNLKYLTNHFYIKIYYKSVNNKIYYTEYKY